MELTKQPAALARMLLATADDYRKVTTPWQIAHLWFDPDTSRPEPGAVARRIQAWFETSDDRDPMDSGRAAARERDALIERARILVDMTSGDPKLRSQLEQVEGRKLRR